MQGLWIIVINLWILSFSSFGQSGNDSKLLEAVKQNNPRATDSLLALGASVNLTDTNGASLLMWAAFKADLSLVEYLVGKGADITRKGIIHCDDQGSTYGNLTGIAAGEGKLELMKYFIEDCKIPVDDKELNPADGTETGWTALLWACYRGKAEIVPYLISAGADVNFHDLQGLTPLHMISRTVYNYLALQMLDHGADVNARTIDGWTPMMIAANFNNLDLCRIYIEYAANKSISNNQGKNAADLAREAGLQRIEDYLTNPRGPGPEPGLDDCLLDFDIAVEYYNNQDYPEAAALFESGLPVIKKEYAASNVQRYIDQLSWAGTCYHYAGRYDKAMPYFEEAYRTNEATLGKSNPDYLNTLIRLAVLYREMGDYSRALPLLEEACRRTREDLGASHPDYAVSLNHLATLYQRTGEYTLALPLFEEACRINKEAFGPEHPAYALSLNNLAGQYQEMANYSLALPLFEEASAIYKNALGTKHPDYALSLNNLSNLYKDMGRYNVALPLCEEACRIYREIFGENHPAYANSLNNMASLYQSLGNFSQALTIYEEVLAIRKELTGIQHTDYAITLTYTASLYREMGDYDRALSMFEEASAIYRDLLGAQSPQFARSLVYQGGICQRMADYSRALALFEEALSLQKESVGTMHPDYASSLSHLAGLYSIMGNYDQALPLYLEVIDIQREVLGTEHPDYANSLDNLASLYRTRQNWIQAAPLIEESMAIRKKVYGTEHPYYATSLNNMALLYILMDYWNYAVPLCEEAISINRKLLGADHPTYATSLSILAVIYQLMGEFDKALPLYEEACRITKQALGDDHPSLATSLNNLAGLYRVMGDYDQATKTYLEANSIINQNIQQNFSFLTESEKKQYYETVGYYYEKYLSFMRQIVERYPGYAGRVYDNELLRKSLILTSLRSMQQAVLSSGDTSLISSYEELSAVKGQITRLQQKPPSDAVIAELAIRKDQAQELERQLTLGSQDIAAMQQQFSITRSEVQKGLKSMEAAVEFVSFRYYDGRNIADSIFYFALVLRPGDTVPQAVYLFEERQLKQALPKPGAGNSGINLSYRGNRGIGTIQMDTGTDLDASSLYDLLWKPLESTLKGVKTIYFSPSGLLHTVSMAAIRCPDGTLLMDRYSLAQLSSTRTLAIPARDKKIRTAAVYGGMVFDMDTMNLVSEAEKYAGQDDDLLAAGSSSPRGGTRSGFNYLEGTRMEAEIVAGECRKKGIQVTSCTGTEGLEESFLALSGPDAPSVIHIATHGFYLPDTLSQEELAEQDAMNAIGEERFRISDDPLLRSGLLMAGGNLAWRGEPVPAGLEDGILTAKEVSNMNLMNTQLVVLSACQTGLGDVKGSEGVEGLLRGFKMAGVRYLILSLWEVPDAETVEFMQHFYDNWLGGQEIRTAFQYTQRQMRDKYPDEPYKWAAFVLVE